MSEEQAIGPVSRLIQEIEAEIWSAIRAGLTMGHTDMRKAVDAKRYEIASAHEDELARKLADRVARQIDPQLRALSATQAVSGWRPMETQAVQDVVAERKRQIEKEGWTQEHDDEHWEGDLSRAAACYASPNARPGVANVPKGWPWDTCWWKPTNRRSNLIKAGALILAEIERLDRALPPQNEGGDGDG